MKKPSNGRSPKNRIPKKAANTKKSAGDVRIIGGQFKRRIVSFIDAEGLRPTPDRLRETLFNWLLADIHGARVLDSCSGSGVLGFEALSRGAAHCTFIEINPAQSNLLRQSAKQLRLEPATYQIIQGTAEQVLSQHQLADDQEQSHFDVVFIDPPYAQDLWQPILTALVTQSLINTDTLIYLEANRDLKDQLIQLAESLNHNFATQQDNSQKTIAFECVKQTHVGQVVAGLYRLTSS